MRGAWLAILLLIPVTVAQYGPDDGGGDTYIEDGCILDLDWDDREGPIVEYSYESICDGLIQEVSYVFRANEDPGFVLSAELVGRIGDSGGVEGVVAALDLVEIVEFVDDGDGQYIPGQDTVIRRDDFDAEGWSSVTTSEGSGSIFFSASYLLSWGAKFEIKATTSGATFDAQGIKVKPADAKIDFLFHDATYVGPTSQYAIVMDVDAQIESVGGVAAKHIQKQEEGVQMGGATGMYFTWAKTAQVDGEDEEVFGWHDVDSEEESVGSGVYEYEGAGPVTLAYAAGEEIVHDPRFGVAMGQAPKKDSPAGSVVFMLGALAALAVASRRVKD